VYVFSSFICPFSSYAHSRVLVGIGVELTFEVIAAAALLRQEVPALRVRVVNVTDLMILGPERSHPHALTDEDFQSLFTKDRDVIVNYHGYASELKGLIFGRKGVDRVQIEGYNEEGECYFYRLLIPLPRELNL